MTSLSANDFLTAAKKMGRMVNMICFRQVLVADATMEQGHWDSPGYSSYVTDNRLDHHLTHCLRVEGKGED